MPKSKSSENGRKKIKWTTVHVSLPRSLVSKVRKLADSDGGSVSYHVGQLIRLGWKSHLIKLGRLELASGTDIQEQSQ